MAAEVAIAAGAASNVGSTKLAIAGAIKPPEGEAVANATTDNNTTSEFIVVCVSSEGTDERE